MSKIGTKRTALGAEPVNFLEEFAKTDEECNFKDVEK